MPAQVQAQIVADPMQSPLLDGIHEVPRRHRRSRPRRASRDARRRRTSSRSGPAFTKLHDFLTAKYLPACRQTIGVDALPNGAAMYAYNVRWHTTTTMTPKEIHEIGLAEVKRIRAEMDTVIAGVRLQGQLSRSS